MSAPAGPDAAAVRAAAAACIARGWSPIPLQPPHRGGKAPILRAWQDHATTEVEVSGFWPAGAGRNIGLALGPSRLVVLDFDEPETFAPWADAHPQAAKSLTVARDGAAAGRCHVYFTLEPGQPAPANQPKAVTGWGDLLSVGRQVVAPPSVHASGGAYRVIVDADPIPWAAAYLPEPLPEAAAFDGPLPPPAPFQPHPAGPGVPPSVAAAVAAGAAEGSRNATAFAIACQLRDEGHAAAAVLPHLEAFAARCSPPLPGRDVLACLASAFRRAPRDPARNPSGAVTVSPAPPAPSAPDAWPEPEPLGALAVTPPAWPWAAMPRTLRDVGMAITETMNVPAELPGLAALCAASIACRKLARVEIKPDHHQFPNVYGMAVLPPAAGKTPACKPLLAPLLAYQIDARRAWAADMRAWSARAKVAAARVQALEKAAMKGGTDGEDLARQIAELEAVQADRPAEPTLFVDNATTEALARAMAGNGGRMGVFSTDARDILSIARGRYTEGRDDITLWLKGHGADYLAMHRAAPDKPPLEIPEPVLSAFLAVQPDALRTLGRSRALADSGFLARFLYVIPEAAGSTDYPEGSVPYHARAAYAETIARLLRTPPAVGPDGEAVPHNCRLDRDGRAFWVAAHNTVRPETVTAAPLLASCIGKLPEHLARIALVFHLVECAEAGQPPGPTLGAPVVERAATLAACLLAHVRRACAAMGDSETKSTARDLWAVLDRNRDRLAALRESEGLGRITAAKPRDVCRFGWAGVEDAEQARELLAVLEVKGWLRLRTAPARTPDARAHELYELRPVDA